MKSLGIFVGQPIQHLVFRLSQRGHGHILDPLTFSEPNRASVIALSQQSTSRLMEHLMAKAVSRSRKTSFAYRLPRSECKINLAFGRLRNHAKVTANIRRVSSSRKPDLIMLVFNRGNKVILCGYGQIQFLAPLSFRRRN